MKNLIHTITTTLDSYAHYAPLVVRVGLAFVFIWFGYSGLTHTAMWTGLVPAWTSSTGPAAALVKIHGMVELVFGILLLLGVYTRLSAFILFLSLLHTVFLVNGPTMVRDIGLLIMLIACILYPEGERHRGHMAI